MILDAILVLAAVATVAAGVAIDGARGLRLNNSVLQDSLQFWRRRHAEVTDQANGVEHALLELMTNRLGFTETGAQEAVRVWKANGWGKASISGIVIDKDSPVFHGVFAALERKPSGIFGPKE